MSNKQKFGLGRGINSLLADNSTFNPNPDAVVNTGEVAAVDINLIVPNPTQPRTDFDEEKLIELSESIKALGVIQPLTLRKIDGGKFEIISDERRYRASKLADLEKVPAYITRPFPQALNSKRITYFIVTKLLKTCQLLVNHQLLLWWSSS